MFEDILGNENEEVKKPKNRVNIMPKGQTQSKKEAMKRAMKLRKELKRMKERGVSPV